MMPGATQVKGCCPLDCQDSCAWVAHVEDGRVIRVEGAKDHPVTRGVLCAKVRDFEQRLTAPDRLLHPLRRVGAKGEERFERIGWDEALDEVASRFKAIIAGYGAEALLPFHYLGSMGVVQRLAPMRLFHALGASGAVGNVCAASALALLAEGYPMAVDPEDAIHAELIILWGQNVLSTAHHQWHFIEQARQRGARIVAIDPRTTRTAKASDQHLKIIPGSDAILAAAIARVLFTEGMANLEDAARHAADLDAYRAAVMAWTLPRAAAATGLSEHDIESLARAYGKARPALIRAGIAPMQTADGEGFVIGLSALAVIGGHWRHTGGGLSILTMPEMLEARASRADLIPAKPRALDIARLGEILDPLASHPPVKGLIVWSANPAVTQIDQPRVRRGLAREDLFTVVFDHFLTDTARYADIVLPATTQFEHFDVQGAWGHYYVSVNHPAVAPMGEAKSGGALMRLLAPRLGLDHPAFAESDEEIAASALPDDWRLADLRQSGWRKLAPARNGPQQPLRLLAEPVSQPAESPAGRLQLLTPKAHYFLNSTFANMPRQRQSQGAPAIEIHPDDAARLGLATGDTVRVSSAAAALSVALKVTDTIRPGLAVLEGKWWSAATEDATMNTLSPSRWSPKGQPAYNETWVTIERVQ